MGAYENRGRPNIDPQIVRSLYNQDSNKVPLNFGDPHMLTPPTPEEFETLREARRVRCEGVLPSEAITLHTYAIV